MVEIARVDPEPPCEKKKRVILVVDSDAAHLYYTGILLQRLDYEIRRKTLLSSWTGLNC